MNKGKIAIVFLISLFLFMGVVSAAQYEVNETSYSDYFENDGSLKNTIVDDDTLVFNGEISNKNFKIDKKLVLEGKNTTKIINGTFNFYGSSSGSTIKGITIVNIDKNALYLTDDVSSLKITDNKINLYGTGAVSNLYGIVAYGTTTNINITNNLINISGNANYNYGIFITNFGEGWATGNENPEDYNILNNTIIANVEKYICGIETDSVLGCNISNNKLNLNSNNLTYGIVVQDMYMADYMNLEPIGGIYISGNTITGKANIVYLIELYMLGASSNRDTNVISNNKLYGEGTSVYGVAAYVSKYLNITGNNITTLGGNYSSITNTGDSIPAGINPIMLYGEQYMGYCQYVNITNNKFETNNGIIVGTPTNQTFAPRNVSYLNNEQTFVIDDESYSYFFDNNGNFLPGVNVTTNNTIRLGTLTNKKLIIDRKLTIIPFDELSKFLYSQLIISGDDASGTIVKNINALSNASVFFIENSNNNILENLNISIVGTENTNYENVVGISIVYESNNNTIRNNVINIKGSSTGGYYYGITVMNGNYPVYGLNPKNNKIEGNKITVDSNNYSDGIYLSMAVNTTVSNNDLNIYGKSFAYGVVVEHNPWAYVNGIEIASDNEIINNKIRAKGGMVYLLRSDLAKDNTFKNNVLYGEGDAVYGYAGTGSVGDIIDANNITVIGTDISKVTSNYDTAGTGMGGIYTNGSSSLKITNNKIISTYKKGGDYAVKLVDSSGANSVKDNYLISDNEKKLGNSAVFGSSKDTIANNTPVKNIMSIKTAEIDQGKKAVIKVSLKDENGKVLSNKEVVLTINGKTYKSKTNIGGIATFQISGLKSGKFKVAGKFAGDSVYYSSIASATQTVKPRVDLAIVSIKKIKTKNKQLTKYKVVIQNKGSLKSKITSLKLWHVRKGVVIKSKYIKVKAISPGKKVSIIVTYYPDRSSHKYCNAYFYVNPKKTMNEITYKNNLKVIKA